MTVYRQFLDAPGVLQIDVYMEGSGPSGRSHSADLAEAIQHLADGAAERLAQLPATRRPSDITLGFALVALDHGGFADRGDDAASFRVSMRWELKKVADDDGPASPPDVPSPSL